MFCIGGRLGEVVAYESWSHREVRLYNAKCKTRLKGFSLAPEADRKQTQKVMGSHFYFAAFQKEKNRCKWSTPKASTTTYSLQIRQRNRDVFYGQSLELSLFDE